MSRYGLSVICQSALLTKKAPTVILRNSSGKLGAPSMIRTCDLLVRRAKKGDRTGQHKTAAPVFSRVFDNLSQPNSTPNRYRLSVICQSVFISQTTRANRHGF